MLRPASRSSSSTSTRRPASDPIWPAMSAKRRGVITFAGSFASARARLLQAARMYPRPTARSIAAVRLRAPRRGHDDEALEGRRLRVRIVLVDARVMRRERQPLGGGLGLVRRVEHAGQDHGEPAPPSFAGRERRGRRRPADPKRVTRQPAFQVR